MYSPALIQNAFRSSYYDEHSDIKKWSNEHAVFMCRHIKHHWHFYPESYEKNPFESVFGRPAKRKPQLHQPFFFPPTPVALNDQVTLFTRKDGIGIMPLIPEITKALQEAEAFNKQYDASMNASVNLVQDGWPFEILDCSINNLSDLIELGKQYETVYKTQEKRFSLNLKVLSGLVPCLEKLNQMVGMKAVKQSIFEKIVFYLQGLENRNVDFLHTVICGAPGMGKTEVAKVIGQIYSKMGFLSGGQFIETKLSDLKAGFLGQTETKTQKVLEQAKGNVLFLDEAYSLSGSDDKIDGYSQSIFDILTPFLDKHRDDFVLIVAGYKDELLKRFFKGNQGLASRFGLWLDIEEYSAKELQQIFEQKVSLYGWKIDVVNESFFEKHKKEFKFYGRDMENLFAKVKLAHAKRVLFSPLEEKKIVTEKDLLAGYEQYKTEKAKSKKEDGIPEHILHSMFL